jgi:hypothetical protein
MEFLNGRAKSLMNCFQERRVEPVRSLIAELERGLEIINDLDVDIFRAAEYGSSSIGAHFRHNLDFVNAFLKGIADGGIDYNDRSRDAIIETRPAYAAKQIQHAVRRLEMLPPEALERIVTVRSEINEDAWYVSSVAREIEFLHSHTVHHHALIERLMPRSGLIARGPFGVAPSTLRYRAGIGNVTVTR